MNSSISAAEYVRTLEANENPDFNLLDGFNPNGRPMVANDLVLGTRITEMDSCRDILAFTMKTYDSETNKSATDLYIHSTQSLTTDRMTYHEWGTAISNPVVALDFCGADPQVLYIKSTDSQVWTMPINGGESRKVTDFPLGVESFKIFTGPMFTRYIICVMSVYPDKTPQQTADIDNAPKATSGMVFDNLMCRHWDTWNCYEKRNHLFVCPLTMNPYGLLEGECSSVVDLMYGMSTDCPPKPFGGTEEYSVDTNTFTASFTCRRVDKDGKQPHNMAWSTEVSIHEVAIPRTYAPNTAPSPASLTLVSEESNHGTNTHPIYTDDGKYLMYLQMEREQYESDATQLICYDTANKTTTNVTKHIDLSFGSLYEYKRDKTHVTVNSYAFFATAQYHACNRLFYLIVRIGEDGLPFLESIKVLAGDDCSRSSPLIGNSFNTVTKTVEERVYFVQSSLTTPGEIRCARLTVGDAEKLWLPWTFEAPTPGRWMLENTPIVIDMMEVFKPCPQYDNGDIHLPQVQSFYFSPVNEDGSENTDAAELVHCWYLPPVDLKDAAAEEGAPAGSVPLVVIIHGGPQGCILNAWNTRWNLSYHAARGYGVVAINFHGSTSFGQKYVDSIRNNWGGQPYRDIIRGTDFILGAKPYLNKDKVGALGASYGGYMINWLNGHNEDGKFKVLVNHDGIFGLKNLYYTTEELWFPEYEFGVPPPLRGSIKDGASVTAECTEGQYEKYDPSLFVDKWATPTLVIQGGLDYRVVDVEGIATFTALQRKGVPSRLLFFPDENHWCLKAGNSLKWHATVSEWVDTYLK